MNEGEIQEAAEIPTIEAAAEPKKQRKPKTSRFLGVYFGLTQKKWIAHGRIDGRKVTFGAWDKEEHAALCYNKRMQARFGKEAILNEVPPDMELPEVVKKRMDMLSEAEAYCSFAEIAKELGVSKQRAHQIFLSGMRKIAKAKEMLADFNQP